MKVTAHQPAFLPWIGFWGKALEADEMLLMTNMEWTVTDLLSTTYLNGKKISIDLVGPRKQVQAAQLSMHSMKKFIKTADQTIWSQAVKKGFVSGGAWWAAVKARLLVAEKDGTIPLQETNLFLLREVAKQFDVTLTPYPYVDLESDDKTDKLMEYLCRYMKRRWNLDEFTYLSGPGGVGYLDKKRVPPGVTVLVQKFHSTPSTNSVVQLIAENSLADVMAAAIKNQYWEPL